LADIGHQGAWQLEWWSIYTANTLCLDDYQHGRVFFIGDSAHIVPIFGVRGLNNGLTDAHNIGWKLGRVLNGEADARLLDSYSPERRGATLDVFANATKSTQFMTPPTRGWRLAREAALSLAIDHEFPRGLANPRQMQPYTYSSSPLSRPSADEAAFAAGPTCGAACPNVKFADGRYLLDLTGDGYSGVMFVDRPLNEAETELLAALRTRDRRCKPILIAIAGANVPGATVADHDGGAAGMLGARPGTFYLLRPDLHVAGRWRTFAAPQILEALGAGLGAPT
ncbi:MAG: FAD-dependent monooxygenase, partial [Hyphomicrobiaceae bacterium]